MIRDEVQPRPTDSRQSRSGEYDAVVIGGGFYGATLAVALTKLVGRVALIEKERSLLRRASYVNQARVHNGYHYPRSILTSLRSRVNYTRFRSEYSAAMDDGFTMVYAVARRLSKLNAQQFVRFCKRIGASITPAPKDIESLFDASTIEAAFVVNECAFDASHLAALVAAQVDAAHVDTFFETVATRVSADLNSACQVECIVGEHRLQLTAANVFNCTYSAANQILGASGYPRIALNHELAEIALVNVPSEFKSLGITVMDGPFFSVMPFPARGGHSMTHVRYTPHSTLHERPGDTADLRTISPDHAHETSFEHMLRDIVRYVPGLARSEYTGSMWEIKTVLPQSEHDDSRPILLHRTPGIGRFWTVLGAKIDGAYDVLDSLKELPGFAASSAR